MAVNLSAIKDLLLPGLRGVEGKYEMIPSQYDKIFTKHDSKMALERTAEMRYLGLAQLKTEGGQTAFDNGAGERYVYNQEHTEIALGYAITRKAIDDNLYKTQFHPSNLGLIESFQQTKEIYGATILNTAQTYNASVGGDGQSLCSLNHPIDGGVIPNTPVVQVDLNESSLLNAMVSIRQNFKDIAGLKIVVGPSTNQEQILLRWNRQNAAAGLAQLAGNGDILRRNAIAAIDHEQYAVCLVHRLPRLTRHFPVHAFGGNGFQPAGINHQIRLRPDTAFAVMAISRQARQVCDDGIARTRQAVKQRRFADVGETDDTDRKRHGRYTSRKAYTALSVPSQIVFGDAFLFCERINSDRADIFGLAIVAILLLRFKFWIHIAMLSCLLAIASSASGLSPSARSTLKVCPQRTHR